jgi:aspartate 1-decarboxylase
MQRHMLKSKIHRATVTACELHYAGSVTIDAGLMESADLLPGEMVHVLDIDNGARFETYVIEGERGAGDMCLNGAAARLVQPGDRVIVVSYGVYSEEELDEHVPKVVHVDERNRIVRVDGDPAALPFAEVAR